jgi:hypothetical protein
MDATDKGNEPTKYAKAVVRCADSLGWLVKSPTAVESSICAPGKPPKEATNANDVTRGCRARKLPSDSQNSPAKVESRNTAP